MKLQYNDDQHAYWLDGKRCKGVTTLAKIPDDTYSLDQWRKRQVVLGMALNPLLVERASAHYDEKDQLNRIAEEAMAAARSHDASARGTAAHRIAERSDLDQKIIDTPYARAVQSAWKKALQDAGLEIVPEYIERIVVYPDHRVAGRFDRIAYRKRDKKFVVVDLKTGESAVRYPHAMAIQLGLYANAPLMAAPIFTKLPNGDIVAGGSTEEFEKLPENLDMRWGVIVHLQEHSVEVHKVDIAAGWELARNAIFPIIKWRARTDLIKPIGTTEIPDFTVPASSERVAWLKGRLALIGMVDGDAKQLTASRWPAHIAPKEPATWTDEDIDTLDEMLRTVERDCGVPFPERDPARV